MPDFFGIPTDIYPSITGNSSGDLNLSTSAKVNFGIDVLRGALTAQSWTQDKEKATTKFLFDLPVSNRRSGIGSLIIDYMYGLGEGPFAFQFWAPWAGEADPTGNFSPSGAVIVGLPTTEIMNQRDLQWELVTSIIAHFNTWSASFLSDPINDPGQPFDGVYQSITILPPDSLALAEGSFLNDYSFNGNILGGGTFAGRTKYGGWNFTSTNANGDTQLRIRLYNNANSNLEMITSFGSGTRATVSSAEASTTLPLRVLHKRSNYFFIVGPHQLIICPYAYTTYVGDNIVEILNGTSDYWLCAPFVPESRRLVDIPYCAFVAESPRDQLNANKVAICVSNRFINTHFFEPDCGMSMMLYNSNGTAAGDLTTVTDLPLQLSATVGLSPGSSLFDREHAVFYLDKPLAVVGYIWDAFMETRYAPLNTLIRKNGKKYVAYRSQQAPANCTLWVAVT